MIILISPAKSLDFQRQIATENPTQPQFLKEAGMLASSLKRKSLKSLKAMMHISDNLAVVNKQRYIDFNTPFTPENAKPALAVFTGDVYLGLEALTLSQEDLSFAQAHLRILSGLYGILRPLDLMQAYRLEMGTSLQYRKSKNLYQFWGDKLSKAIQAELKEKDDFIVNLASAEYFKVIKPAKIKAPIYTVQFKEYKDGKLTFISFNAKRARGIMAKWLIQNKIQDLDSIYNFKMNRYQFEPSESDVHNLVFTRKFIKAGS